MGGWWGAHDWKRLQEESEVWEVEERRKRGEGSVWLSDCLLAEG